MKKNVIRLALALLASMFTLSGYSQDVQMATLQHGETMKAYYGTEALKEAVAAAEKGDIITLSGGVFKSLTIDKPVVIQGAGYVQDAAHFRYRTAITGDTYVNIPEGESGLVIEGIFFGNRFYLWGDSIKQFTLRKCCLSEVFYSASSSNCEVSQCKINSFSLQASTTQNLYMHHSVINTVAANSGTVSSWMIDHCVITNQLQDYVTAFVQNSLVKNPRGTSACSFFNNVFSYNTYSYCANITAVNVEGNVKYECYKSDASAVHDSYKALFANQEAANHWRLEYDYKLTEEAAAQFLGNDGTQVGIYGGQIPFSDVPTNPQIVSKNIASQSDENGKLSVKITVEAQQ